MTTREAFESWISAQPIGADVSRTNNESAFPNQYVIYSTQLAWEAWIQATSKEGINETGRASKCTHDLAERETACADGMCPICLDAEVQALKGELNFYENSSDLHSCSDQCQRPMCVMRRNRDAWRKMAEQLASELKQIEGAYANEEPISAKWATEALAAFREMEKK